MNEYWIMINETNKNEYSFLMERLDLIQVKIDGKKIKTKNDFFEIIEEKLQFPTKCTGKYSRFEDWITDLSWLPEEQGICIQINDYQDFLLDDFKAKTTIENIFQETVLPFWKESVCKYVKGGRPREFYVIVS